MYQRMIFRDKMVLFWFILKDFPSKTSRSQTGSWRLLASIASIESIIWGITVQTFGYLSTLLEVFINRNESKLKRKKISHSTFFSADYNYDVFRVSRQEDCWEQVNCCRFSEANNERLLHKVLGASALGSFFSSFYEYGTATPLKKI